MNPNAILGKYLIKQIVINFLAVLLMVMGIVLMFEVIELLRRTSDRTDVDAWFIMQMAVTKLPRTLEMVFPFVMMIAAMITFWRLSKSNEFVIIRAAGVSIWGFLTPVLFAVFTVGVLNITVINPISAQMYEAYETLDYRFKTKNPKAVLFSDKGLWIREAIDENRFLVLQAKSLRQEGKNLLLRDVDILEMDRNSQILKRVEAFAAVLENKEFELKDVKVFEAGKPTLNLNNVKYQTTLTAERIKENFVDPEAISFWDLPGTIKFYEMSGFSALRHHMRYLTLLASPFMLCAMVLVAAAEQQARRRNVFDCRRHCYGFYGLFYVAGNLRLRHQRLYSEFLCRLDTGADCRFDQRFHSAAFGRRLDVAFRCRRFLGHLCKFAVL